MTRRRLVLEPWEIALYLVVGALLLVAVLGW